MTGSVTYTDTYIMMLTCDVRRRKLICRSSFRVVFEFPHDEVHLSVRCFLFPRRARDHPRLLATLPGVVSAVLAPCLGRVYTYIYIYASPRSIRSVLESLSVMKQERGLGIVETALRMAGPFTKPTGVSSAPDGKIYARLRLPQKLLFFVENVI